MAHLEEHMAVRLLESEQNAQVRARCSKLRAAQRPKHSRGDRAWGAHNHCSKASIAFSIDSEFGWFHFDRTRSEQAYPAQ